MRRGWGRGGSIVWGVALWAGCGPAVHPSPGPQPQNAWCVLIDPPAIARDTATIAFRSPSDEPRACAQTLVVEHLRTWRTELAHPWTVGMVLTAAGATVRRFDSRVARNLIDGGQPLLVTEDVDLVAYAAARPDLQVVPLAWDRTYVLLAPATDSTLGTAVGPDAVRVDARAAEPLACDSSPGGASSGAVNQRSSGIVYDARDPTARALAERIVALTTRTEMTAIGMQPAELDAAITAGRELAYVISVPSASRCSALAAMAARTPWIGGASAVPLIETRAHGIAPRSSRP